MRRSTWFVLAASVLASATVADEPKDKQQLPPWQRLLKGDDATTAADLAKRIGELEAADEYADAIKLAEKLLALRQRVQGADHWKAVTQRFALEALRKVAALSAADRAEGRLAAEAAKEAAAMEQRGQFGPALRLRERRLAWCRKVFGENHPETAEAGLTNVASNLNGQGKYADAEPLLQKALEIWRKSLGEDHPDTATGYNNVACNLNAQGRYAEAAPLLQKSLDITRKAVGDDHPDTAVHHANVAGNLRSQGRHADAAPHFQKSLDITRKAVGDDHLDTAQCYDSLATNLGDQGRYADAAPLFLKGLEIRRKALGDDHAETASGYYSVAGNLNDQGKYAEAGPLYRTALAIRRKALGDSHPETVECYNSLALNLYDQGKHAEAEGLFQKSLDLRREALGEDHAHTATGYNNVAINLNAQGRYDDAGPFYQKALDIRRKVLGDDHSDTAGSYNNLAFNLNAQGRHAEATPLCQKALDVWRRAHGEGHPTTALGYNNLAFNLKDQGKYAEAGPVYEKALDINRKALGDDHPRTGGGYNNLATNLMAQRRYADARSLLLSARRTYEIARLSVASEGLDRAAFGADRSPYSRLAATHARLQEAAAAWAAAEADLARGLLDESAGRRGSLTSPEDRAVQRQLAAQALALQPRLLALAIQPVRTLAETKELDLLRAERTRLSQGLADLAATSSRREVATLADVRAALPADAALVLWVDAADTFGGVQEHWGCVVRPTGDPVWERLLGSGPDKAWTQDDMDLPKNFRLALAGDDKTPPASAAAVAILAQRMYAQRLAPLENHLHGVRRLEVVPVGEMAGLPVEALTDRFVVSYTPSGTAMARRAKRSPSPAAPALLALGDPVFDAAARAPKSPSALPPGGLLVTQVVPGGNAAKAGLQAGDVLLRYAGTELKAVEQLGQLVQANAEKSSVAIEVWRDGQERSATKDVPPGKLGVVLAKEPAPEAIANRRKADAMLLALRGGDRADLPGTRVELARLANLFGPSSERLLDSDASEQRLDDLRAADRLKGYRYIHLATHGETNDAKAFESALILAQDKLPQDPLANLNRPEGAQFIDGRLTANEVLAGWKLDADLVTLSACESGLGRKGGGDGLLGFAQAFLLAGARSVCLSLWKVDDAATALLMGRFYENLLGKRAGLAKAMPKAEALAEAKAWLRNLSADEAASQLAGLSGGVARGTGRPALPPLTAPKPEAAATDKPYAHPRFWAAFVLIGDPG